MNKILLDGVCLAKSEMNVRSKFVLKRLKGLNEGEAEEGRLIFRVRWAGSGSEMSLLRT